MLVYQRYTPFSDTPPEKYESDWIIIPTIGDNKIPWFQTTSQLLTTINHYQPLVITINLGKFL